MKKGLTKGMSWLLLITGALLILFGTGWNVVIYFDNWKYVLTPFAKFILYWKPDGLIILGLILARIGLIKL